MFSIGSHNWGGISKLIEEAGEVIQVCGKLIGTNGEPLHWEGTNLKSRLEEEIADLSAAIAFVVTHCELDAARIALRVGKKIETFERWHAEPVAISESRRKNGIIDP